VYTAIRQKSLSFGVTVMERNHIGRHVVVNSSGGVELRSTAGGAPLSCFEHEAVFAVMMSDLIRVNKMNWRTFFISSAQLIVRYLGCR